MAVIVMMGCLAKHSESIWNSILGHVFGVWNHCRALGWTEWDERGYFESGENERGKTDRNEWSERYGRGQRGENACRERASTSEDGCKGEQKENEKKTVSFGERMVAREDWKM